MKYLLILDLSDTLIESPHIVYRFEDNSYYQKNHFKEYQSRINNIARKINCFAQEGNKVVIITSESHSSAYNLCRVLDDIDEQIIYKENVNYFLAGYTFKKHNNINIINCFARKDDVYDLVLRKYSNYYPIAIDDRAFDNLGFIKVIKMGGECAFICNEDRTLSLEYFPNHFSVDEYYSSNYDIGMLIEFYQSVKENAKDFPNIVTSTPEIINFSKQKIIEKLNDGSLDIIEFYNWYNLEKIKDYFFKKGKINIEGVEDYINHQCINMYPSFEMAYQKRIVLKLRS